MRRVAVFLGWVFLVASGCLPEPKTPLTRAAVTGPEEVRRLIEAGADVNEGAGTGWTPLISNAAGGGALFDFTDGPRLGTCHPAVVRALLARTPDLELRPGPGLKVARWVGGSRGCPETWALLGARAPR